MKYTCLLIDHDDTAVDSTPAIHYPAHREQMIRLNREKEILNLEDWFRVNYHPGIRPFLKEQLRLKPEEEKLCYAIWREFTLTRTPPFFPGMMEFLEKFTSRGGAVFVVSHSEEEVIRRHYMEQKDCPGFMPHGIFGWNGNPEQTKPHTWPVDQISHRFGYKKENMLMMDDLKPGIIMAQRAGVDSLGAGWSHSIPEIQDDLARESTVFFQDREKAFQWVLDQ